MPEATSEQQSRAKLVGTVRKVLLETATDLDMNDQRRAEKIIDALAGELMPLYRAHVERIEHHPTVSTGVMPSSAPAPQRGTLLAALDAPAQPRTNIRGGTFTIRYDGKCPTCQGDEWVPPEMLAMVAGEQGGYVDDVASCYDCWEAASD